MGLVTNKLSGSGGLRDAPRRLDGEERSIKDAEVKRGLEVGRVEGATRPQVSGNQPATADGGNIVINIPSLILATSKRYEDSFVKSTQHPWKGVPQGTAVVTVLGGFILYNDDYSLPLEAEYLEVSDTDVTVTGAGFGWLEVGLTEYTTSNVTLDSAEVLAIKSHTSNGSATIHFKATGYTIVGTNLWVKLFSTSLEDGKAVINAQFESSNYRLAIDNWIERNP